MGGSGGRLQPLSGGGEGGRGGLAPLVCKRYAQGHAADLQEAGGPVGAQHVDDGPPDTARLRAAGLRHTHTLLCRTVPAPTDSACRLSLGRKTETGSGMPNQSAATVVRTRPFAAQPCPTRAFRYFEPPPSPLDLTRP